MASFPLVALGDSAQYLLGQHLLMVTQSCLLFSLLDYNSFKGQVYDLKWELHAGSRGMGQEITINFLLM